MNQAELWKRPPVEAALERIKTHLSTLRAEVHALAALDDTHSLMTEAPTLAEHRRQALRAMSMLEDIRATLRGEP